MNRDEHRAIRESLGAYALGGLAPLERDAVGAHLDGCAQCRAEADEIATVAGPLRAVDPSRLDTTPVPPPWLGDRIVEAARAQGPLRTGARRGALAGVAAAAVVAVVAGGLGYVVGSSGTQPDVPRESVAVQAMAGDVDASASVVPHTWGVEIILAADGFAAGQVYRVVVLDRAGRPVDAGQFLGTGERPMVCNLNSSVLRTQATGFDVLGPDGSVVVHGTL